MFASLRSYLSRMSATLRPARHEREFRAELEAHLQMMVDDLIAKGMSEADALRKAKITLGAPQLEEAHWDWSTLRWLHDLIADMRLALRQAWFHPQFALSAILTASVAIGAATAVFSVADRSLFRPLPYAQPDRLVNVGIVAPVISARDWLFAGTYQEWKGAAPAFESMAAWKDATGCDRSDETPERFDCALVDRDFLAVLGTQLAMGRNFALHEDEPGGDPVAIVSFRFWLSRLGGDARALGRLIVIDGVPRRIVGVLPRSFEMPSLASADFLLPLQLRRGSQRQRVVQAIGRLRADVTLKAAQAQTAPLFQRFTESAPLDFRQAVPMELRVTGFRHQQTRTYRSALLMLCGAVLAFLLMACANVASLLMAKAEARRHEFAARAALGASPNRLARQALAESIVLGLVSGMLGCGFAYWFVKVFNTLAQNSLLGLREAVLDLRVLFFAVALSLAASLLFGLAPALQQLRREAFAAPRVAGVERRRFASLLVALQLAISVVLMSLGSMFAASFWKLQQTSLGFIPEHVVSATFILPTQRYESEERQIAFFTELERRISDSTGVTASAITDSLPPGGDPRSAPFVSFIGGGDAGAAGSEGLVKWRHVTPGYFRTLGIPIIRGREFLERERGAGVPPVIVNEGLARRLFGSTEIVGKQLRDGEIIVGVAANARNSGVSAAADGEFYVLRTYFPNVTSRNQRPPFGWRLAIAVVRTQGTGEAAGEILRTSVQAIDPAIPVVVKPMMHLVDEHYAQQRFQTVLLSLFALVSLILAIGGLYGLTSFLAAAKTREIGVRVAVGATPYGITAHLMRTGLLSTAAGIVAGGLASLGIAQLLKSLIQDLHPPEPSLVGIAIACMCAAALLGTAVPSFRAARRNPVDALRES